MEEWDYGMSAFRYLSGNVLALTKLTITFTTPLILVSQAAVQRCIRFLEKIFRTWPALEFCHSKKIVKKTFKCEKSIQDCDWISNVLGLNVVWIINPNLFLFYIIFFDGI